MDEDWPLTEEAYILSWMIGSFWYDVHAYMEKHQDQKTILACDKLRSAICEFRDVFDPAPKNSEQAYLREEKIKTFSWKGYP